MKKYSDPTMRIKIFNRETVVTTSVTTLENWKTQENGTILKERNYQAMTDLTKITF